MNDVTVRPMHAPEHAGIALHGLCFGCFIFVAFMIVDEETTGDVRASAQNLFNLVNNTQLRPLEVPQRRRSILYIEGEPRWEYKFIRRALDEDAPVRLATLLRTNPAHEAVSVRLYARGGASALPMSQAGSDVLYALAARRGTQRFPNP